MKKMRQTSLACAGAVALTLALLVPTSAYANTSSTTDGEPEEFVVTAPMNIVGYDAEVAEAHGYRIETDANGVQYSVPVTPEAIAEAARDEAAASELMQARGTVQGNCGQSSLTGRKGPNDTVHFSTSFVVVGSVAEYDWAIDAQGFVTSNSWATAGVGPLPGGSKAWTGAIPGVIGFGNAQVPANSARAAVIKSNGGVCWSGGPSFTFD